jgi:hypothetical protein
MLLLVYRKIQRRVIGMPLHVRHQIHISIDWQMIAAGSG